jgi:CheY-like chemotaxis protein
MTHIAETQSQTLSLVNMVVEDNQLIQKIVEEALNDGGFEPLIAASGEEAVTVLREKRSQHRALVTAINLLGRIDGWVVANRPERLIRHSRSST